MPRKIIRTLVLEDDLETLSLIYKLLSDLEDELKVDFVTVQYSTYLQVESHVNDHLDDEYDLILLDRDCKAAGSFHVIDIDRFGSERFIAISSVPDYNKDAANRGVSLVAFKDFQNMESFIDKLKDHVVSIIS